MVCAAACSLAPITCDPWVDLRSSPRLDALTWLASGGADSSLIEASVAVNAVGGVPLSSELLTAVIGVAWLAYAASVFRQAPASTRKRSALFLVFLLMVAVRTVLSNGVVRQLELGSSAPGTCLWVQSHDSATAPLIALIGVVFLDWSDTTSKAFSREDLAAGAAILLVGIPASVFYYFTAQSAALGPSETFDWHIVAGLSILIGLLLGLWAARSEITKRCRRARSCKPRWDDWLDLFQLLAFPLLFALLNIDSSETEGCPPWSFKGRSLGQSPLAPPGAHWPEGMDPASPAARARVLDAIEAKAALSLAISANTIALILAQLLRSHSEASSVAELEAQAAASELRLAVGSVSHEARGPLNSAMLSLGLFDDSAPPAARAVIANDLRAAILASKRQLDELNAWDEGAAAARGRKADPTWAPMGGLSRALLMRFGGACRSAGIKLNLSLSGAKCATWKSTRARRRSPDARGGAAGAEHAAASSAFCSAAVSDAKAMTGADSAASASAAAAASGAAAVAAAGTTSTHRAGPSCEPLEGSRPAGCEPAFGTEPPLVAARSASLASVQVAGGATADSLVLEGMEPVRGWEVLLDHDLLVSAVANAVSNAVKHSPYGSGRIGVAVACAVGKQFTLASGMQEPHDPAMRRHGSATSSASGASARRQDAGSGMLAAAASASPPRSGGHRSAAADAGASPRPPLTPDVQVALPGVLHVEVHDNGRGIPAAMLREGALFTPFARLRDGDESLRMSSSGLGLSIMRRCVVDGLGGLVGLASREGRGTTTYIRVPALFRRPAQAAEGVGGCPASGGGGAAESGNDGTEAPLEAGMSREAAADGGAVEKQPSAHGGWRGGGGESGGGVGRAEAALRGRSASSERLVDVSSPGTGWARRRPVAGAEAARRAASTAVKRAQPQHDLTTAPNTKQFRAVLRGRASAGTGDSPRTSDLDGGVEGGSGSAWAEPSIMSPFGSAAALAAIEQEPLGRAVALPASGGGMARLSRDFDSDSTPPPPRVGPGAGALPLHVRALSTGWSGAPPLAGGSLGGRGRAGRARSKGSLVTSIRGERTRESVSVMSRRGRSSEAGSDSAASDWSGDGSERTPSEREAARQERAARRAMRRGERQRSRAPDSHAGSGAAFTRAASAGPDPARRREVNIPGWLVGQLAYVVDDERTNRTLMAHLLRRWGLRVETFEDGRQLMDALAALGRKPHEDATAGPATPTHPAPGKRLWTASASASAARGMAATNLPAIIMLDIEMPRLDGFGALAEMNGMVAAGTLPFRPPVIVVTGNTRTRDRMRLEELGCRSIVFKPYDQDSLLAEVRKLRPGKQST